MKIQTFFKITYLKLHKVPSKPFVKYGTETRNWDDTDEGEIITVEVRTFENILKNVR
jgi:hypothetical protein